MPLEVLPVKSKDKYLRHYQDFKNFEKEYPFNATLDVIILDYIKSLREQGLKISTIRSYVSAITTKKIKNHVLLYAKVNYWDYWGICDIIYALFFWS